MVMAAAYHTLFPTNNGVMVCATVALSGAAMRCAAWDTGASLVSSQIVLLLNVEPTNHQSSII